MMSISSKIMQPPSISFPASNRPPPARGLPRFRFASSSGSTDGLRTFTSYVGLQNKEGITAALTGWQFRPLTMDGRLVEVETGVTFRFRSSALLDRVAPRVALATVVIPYLPPRQLRYRRHSALPTTLEQRILSRSRPLIREDVGGEQRDGFMKSVCILALGVVLAAGAAFAEETAPKGRDAVADKRPLAKIESFKPEEQTSEGSVTVDGSRIDYQAVAGTLIVHPKGWDDAAKTVEKDSSREDQQNQNRPDGASGSQNPTAEASMFYIAYFRKGAASEARPVTFLFNGGPGSSTIWLHMGAFGPKRVVTADNTHSPAAPYAIVSNDQSLLDASDLVFVDAPGTGFSRISGKDKEKAFYGVDPDAHAFAEFITGFLSKYSRWNSPKYLFGESYGTTRSAALINLLETDRHVDFNGVILLSQILNFDLSADGPQFNPGVNLPYQLALPTYAATAWYHHKLAGNPKDLPVLLEEVEHFAMTDYALALRVGAALDQAQRMPSPPSCMTIPDCPSSTSRRPICASMAANSKRPCRTTAT